MNNLFLSSLSELDLPIEYKRYYDFRISSFFWRLSQENEICISEWTELKNQDLWELLIKNDLLKWNLEFTLLESWYELFSEVSLEEFQNNLDNNIGFARVLLKWKVLFWFNNNFGAIVIATKFYWIKEAVHNLVN